MKQFYVEVQKEYAGPEGGTNVLTILGWMPIRARTALCAWQKVDAMLIRKPGCLQTNDSRIKWEMPPPNGWEYVDLSFVTTGNVRQSLIT